MSTASMIGLKPLRDHQQRAIDGLRLSLSSGNRRPLLQAPTGAGKTVIAAHIVAGARSKFKRVCFCVPSIGLVDQTFERFCENGIEASDMGVLQADHPWRKPHAPIQIATAQTLARRARPETDIVVIDEAHLRFDVYERWMAETSLPFIGLSATPWSVGLGKLYDDLIKPTSLAELIELGLLSPFKVYAPSHPDLTGIKTVAGDYHEGELAERMNKAELVADVVQTWQARGADQPTLCFATGREHAKALRDRFELAGVPVAYVDANTPREERDDIGRQLASGQIKVVCNIGCLTTGIDWDVRCLILARPTKSEILYVQIIGRALRTAPGKDYAVILDHSDTTSRLGFVTDIDHDTLDDGRKQTRAERKAKERGIPLPKECLTCAGLIPAHASECPCCGAARPKQQFREATGELVEVGSAGQGSKAGKQSVTDLLRAMGKQSIYGQLQTIREFKGSKPGWVYFKYKEIFGVGPRGLDEDYRERPCFLLQSWLQSRHIAYMKSLEKAGAAHA